MKPIKYSIDILSQKKTNSNAKKHEIFNLVTTAISLRDARVDAIFYDVDLFIIVVTIDFAILLKEHEPKDKIQGGVPMQAWKRWIASVIAAVCFASLIAAMGGDVAYFIDLPSLVIVLIFPFLYLSALYGFSGVALAFRTTGNKDAVEAELRVSLAFFRSYGKATWLFSLFAACSSTIVMLGDLTDPSELGAYFAIILICPLYAVMFNLLLTLPYAAHAERRLAELSDGR